LLELNTRMWN